jgi:hypothetical protein
MFPAARSTQILRWQTHLIIEPVFLLKINKTAKVGKYQNSYKTTHASNLVELVFLSFLSLEHRDYFSDRREFPFIAFT